MALAWPSKDPDEVLDYTIDWTDRLTDETIETSTWTITGEDDELTQDTDTIANPYTVIWLSSGTLGVKYSLTNRITTTGGRTMDQTVTLKLKAK